MTTKDLIDYLKKLSSADWNKKANPKWIVKDVVAHLVGWEKANLEAIQAAVETQKDPVWLEVKNDDEFNEKSVEFYKNYSGDELITEWQKLSGQVVEEKKKVDNLQTFPILSKWLRESEEHLQHHFDQISRINSNLI